MSMLDASHQPFDELALQQHISDAVGITQPRGRFLDRSYPVIRTLFRTELIDTDNISEAPCLFIGNHSLFAMDGMVLLPTLYRELGRFLRPMGDKFLWNAASNDFLLSQGSVIGDPQVCSALMNAGQDLLVFPGGANESTKTQAQRYTLQWKDRYGFVRLAAQHGYTIQPFAMIGPDEFYDHLLEGEQIPDSRLGQLLRRAGLLNDNTRADLLPPIPLGALGSLLPKPQKCYVQFGEPVSLARYQGRKPARKTLLGIRDQVADQIEIMIPDLLQRRDDNDNRGLLRRMLTL